MDAAPTPPAPERTFTAAEVRAIVAHELGRHHRDLIGLARGYAPRSPSGRAYSDAAFALGSRADRLARGDAFLAGVDEPFAGHA